MRRAAGANRRVPFVPLVLGLLIASVLSAVVSLAFGSERIPVTDVVAAVGDRLQGAPPGQWDVIVWELRLPRALMALVVGAGIGLAPATGAVIAAALTGAAAPLPLDPFRPDRFAEAR